MAEHVRHPGAGVATRANIIGTRPIGVPVEPEAMSEPTAAYDRELDVREVDGEPFHDIMAALGELGAGETLLLVNSFEPEPLYAVIEQQGFTYDTTRVADDEWHIAVTAP